MVPGVVSHGYNSAYFGSELPTPVSLGGPEARVAPILGGATGFGASGVLPTCVGTAHPMASEAIRASRVQKFSGRAEDWEVFERQWNAHLHLMAGAAPGPLSDTVVLATLRSYLDEASAITLEGRMHTDPSLSYYKFWQELKDCFVRDARSTHRQAWKGVRLQITGAKISLSDWAKFQAQYLDKRALVEDWSDLEDQHNVLSQVPPEMQSRIMRETSKRKANKKWVQVVVPPLLSAPEVIEELSQVLGRPLQRDTKIENRHFVVHCQSETEMHELYKWDGASMDGHPLRVQRADYFMSGDDIFAFVRQMLQEDEDLRALRIAMGQPADPPRSPREVRAVQVEPVPVQRQPRPFDTRPQGGRGVMSSSRNAPGTFPKKSTSPLRTEPLKSRIQRWWGVNRPGVLERLRVPPGNGNVIHVGTWVSHLPILIRLVLYIWLLSNPRPGLHQSLVPR